MASVKITVRDNGSLRVEGDFELCDMAGNVYDLAGRTAISLCRCGHSQNKPFCDSSHKLAGFQSAVQAHALPPPAPAVAPVTPVAPKPSGS